MRLCRATALNECVVVSVDRIGTTLLLIVSAKGTYFHSHIQKTYCAKVVFTCFTLQTAWIMTKYHDNLLPIHCGFSIVDLPILYLSCAECIATHIMRILYLQCNTTHIHRTFLHNIHPRYMVHNLRYSISAGKMIIRNTHTYMELYISKHKHSIFHIHSIIYYLRIVWTCTHRVYLFL